jgi:hypothetical protein
MAKKTRKRPETAPEPRPEEPKRLNERTRLQDDAAVRQKSSGHKKATADKWNQ